MKFNKTTIHPQISLLYKLQKQSATPSWRLLNHLYSVEISKMTKLLPVKSQLRQVTLYCRPLTSKPILPRCSYRKDRSIEVKYIFLGPPMQKIWTDEVSAYKTSSIHYSSKKPMVLTRLMNLESLCNALHRRQNHYPRRNHMKGLRLNPN